MHHRNKRLKLKGIRESFKQRHTHRCIICGCNYFELSEHLPHWCRTCRK